MHKKFDHTAIEKKWQHAWEEGQIYKTDGNSTKPKAYVLDMFPYPSGEGLHVGHPKGYIATDVYSRFKKMSGFEVLHPMGWDAFGLPAENYVIKNKIHPRAAVATNIANFKKQLGELGFNYDWTREINTTDPEYYKWTQWIFLKLLEKGLAYESYEPINWCPGCQTGLANEDLESDGTCERCGSVVEKRPMRQWVLKITAYADRMLKDLNLLSWPEHIKEAQRNWIGRSEGAELDFSLTTGEKVTVFTTRPDTLFGATYLVLAPEHALLPTLQAKISNWSAIDAYRQEAAKKKEIERTAEGKEKSGIQLAGVMAINPATGEEIPVYIADFVLAHYGTGAIMAVPAHDERDGEFAAKFEIPIRTVIEPVFTKTKGDDAFRQNAAVAEREAITAIVRNPKNNNYLGLRWKKVDWETFITGGVERGQSPEEAARAEILEETGYKHLKLISVLPRVHARFWHVPKTENRFAHFHTFLFELEDEEKEPLSEEEAEKHESLWLTEEELQSFNLPESHRFLIEHILGKNPIHTGSGILTNSGELNGLPSEEAKEEITRRMGGRSVATYKIKDWVFSRQRYWGEPIPVIHCKACGVVPVPEDQLPVTLPEVEHYAPTGTGESPLADIEEWVNVPCPKCGVPGKRETNTMPQWAGSSWYYLRFIDPKNDAALIDSTKEKKWSPVDVYVGGDHAVRHLIYARFWHKFLFDIDIVSSEEPFLRLEFLGFILAEDGRKMSKRWGNIINPSTIVEKNGADTLRVYEMFMGPFENTIAWSTDGLVGAQRFLERVCGLSTHVVNTSSATLHTLLHQTIKKVSGDIELFKFNTAVSAMMIFLNAAEKDGLSKEDYQSFLRLLAPFAPHLTEELWHEAGESTSIHLAPWPEADESLLASIPVKVTVQINGKTRGAVEVAQDSNKETVLAAAEANPLIKGHLDKTARNKVIFVKNKIINILGDISG